MPPRDFQGESEKPLAKARAVAEANQLVASRDSYGSHVLVVLGKYLEGYSRASAMSKVVFTSSRSL